MEHFSIRQFEEKDIDFAHKLNRLEQWNDTRNDVERMLSYEPNGCFIAETKGTPVGHVFSILYGRLGWIGFLIVKAEFRRKGAGILLLKKAVDYLSNRKAETIRLEAVPAIAGMYRKLGFTDEYDSLRFRGISRIARSTSRYRVKLLEKENIIKLAEFDAQYFGANRIQVLRGLHRHNPQQCLIAYINSIIAGYIMYRETERGYKIGPWICNPDNSQVASELFIKCMEAIGKDEKIWIGFPAVNRTAVRILHDYDFEQYSKSIRMFFGKRLETEKVDGVFAISGPEKG